MSVYSLIKKLCFTGLLFTFFSLRAQQVKKIDCCKDINAKATIIINDNTVSAGTGTAASTANGSFNFELTNSVNTSAGVYNTDGNLVRTLWGGVRYDAGCYLGQWDGLLDDGTQAPYGNYTVKVLTNNVQYTWEGGIGDSSTEPLNDATKLVGNDYTTWLTIGTKAFTSNGYSEHGTSQIVLNLSDINKRMAYTGTNFTTLNGIVSCTDGNIIYIGGDKSGDPTNSYQSWIVGTYPADAPDPTKFIPFAARTTASYRGGSGDFTDNNAIAYSTDAASYINDITVQKTANFLFVARAGLNQLQVYDKRVSSGALQQVVNMVSCIALACDANSFLYVVTNNTLKKYTVNSDGTLTDTGISFSGLVSPSRLTYSIELGKLAVFDNATFQIKVYNPSGGAPVQVIGNPGGYTASPFFNAANFVDANFIYYQQDGTFWIGQPALHSVLHLNAGFTLKEETQHLPTSRCITANQNNPTSVFANFNEYARDYSKTLDNGINGSWKFVANWSKGINTTNQNYDGIVWAATLSNNKTYALTYTGGRNQLVELTSTGSRQIQDYFDGNIGRDGTVLIYGDNGSYGNQPTGIYRRLLTGFDSNNNPVWTAPALWVANPANHPASAPWYGYQNKTTGITATADKYIYFNNGIGTPAPDESVNNYRLGAIRASNDTPIWQTAKTTFYNYNGPYPSDGSFDIGNNTGYLPQHSETHAMVWDNHIFWNVNGEFWQNTEANCWNHVDGNTGLLIGHFGTDGNIAGLLPGKPGMAGNAFSTAMVKVGDDYYIYHCDESVHAFIHSWHVTGLNTANITTIPITLSTLVSLSTDATDMMAGIPFKSSGFYGGAGTGWTMNPANYDAHSNGDAYPDWRVTTTKNSYRKDDNDIYFESDNNANGAYKTATRTLGSNNTSNWTLTGSFKLYRNINDKTKYDILDASGKILITFYTGQDNNIYVNGTAYQSGIFDDRICSFKFTGFTIKNMNGQVTFAIDNYSPVIINSPSDSGANFKTPANFRVRAGGSGDNNHTLVSIKSLFFYYN